MRLEPRDIQLFFELAKQLLHRGLLYGLLAPIAQKEPGAVGEPTPPQITCEHLPGTVAQGNHCGETGYLTNGIRRDEAGETGKNLGNMRVCGG